MAKRDLENITLGAVKVFIAEYDATKALPSHTEICVTENLMGYTQGGAELAYTEEIAEEKDDLGFVSKVLSYNEDARVKLGMITWNGNTLAQLADRCKVTENTTTGLRTIHIGGAGNSQGKEWVVCLFHEDKKGGNLWIMFRGRNTAGFTLSFTMDAASKAEPEFVALPLDDSGTRVIMIEEIGTATTTTTT